MCVNDQRPQRRPITHALGLFFFQRLLLAFEVLKFLFELPALALRSFKLLDREPFFLFEPLDLGIRLRLARGAARRGIALALPAHVFLKRNVPVALLLCLFELTCQRRKENVRALGAEWVVELRPTREQVEEPQRRANVVRQGRGVRLRRVPARAVLRHGRGWGLARSGQRGLLCVCGG